jgi:formate hydrogenlyase subunit 6/NADH:ubiquinone oxidoreductase subunit I
MTEQKRPQINLALCDRCGACVEGCPVDALVMTEHGPEFSSPLTCTYCTDCEGLCPVGAIRAPLNVVWET